MVQVAPSHRSARVCTIPDAKCCSPVAVQADGAVQDTPLKKLCTAPAGLGVSRMAHRFPFHHSAKVFDWDPAVKYAPAARHADGDRHDTLPRPLCTPPPWGLGVGRMVQVSPSHRSASVPESDAPTEMHAKGELHDTPPRPAPGRVGAGWMRHAVPFHRSTSAALAPDPAAKQADRAGQAMPPKALSAAPAGFGVGCNCHLAPSHRCAMVSGVPEPCEY